VRAGGQEACEGGHIGDGALGVWPEDRKSAGEDFTLGAFYEGLECRAGGGEPGKGCAGRAEEGPAAFLVGRYVRPGGAGTPSCGLNCRRGMAYGR
jgi:hypothetical protein